MNISIIIAIYNRKEELSELLQSLVYQTDKDFEVIVVDDGSSVDLRPTIQYFQPKLSLHFFRKENSGPGLTRNYGADHAKGDWLVFLDSDVIVKPSYIANIKKDIVNIPCDAFGGADKAHPDFNPMQKAISYAMTSIFTTGGIRGRKAAMSKFQPRSFNMGVRKDAFSRVGGFSELRVGEDPDLSMTLWERGYTTAFFDDIAVYHKRRADFSQFSKQVYQFGIARPILNQRHPEYTKITFWFPSLFLLGYIIGLLHYFVWHQGLLLALYGLYTLVIWGSALYKTRSLGIAAMAVVASYIQLFSYGYGFLKSWVCLNLLKQKPEVAFPTHFYQKH